MKYLAICEDDLLFQFMGKVATRPREVLFLVQTQDVSRRIRRRGGSSQGGALESPETYERAHLESTHQAILFLRDAPLRERVYSILRALRGDLPILSLCPGAQSANSKKDPLLRKIPLEDIFKEFCAPQLLDVLNQQRV